MKLKEFIEDHRLKQSELCDLFGRSSATVSRIVKGDLNITGLQIRQLIDAFGYDTIAPYAEPGEMPVQTSVTINAPKISGNTAPVQNGDGNSMSVDAQLIDLLKKKDEQIDRLISLLESKYKPTNE